MKTVLDNATRDELISRINSINENSKAEWGKMNSFQMVRHCILAEEMFLGKTTHKRAFLGRLIGKMVLKNILKDDEPMRKNSPTSPIFIVAETNGDLQSEKNKWTALVQEYETYANHDYVHWFFGKMTKEQVGFFAYKHADHHLRQFNL